MDSNKKTIYFAGGCFWGVEHFFSQIDGVLETSVGYANGKSANTSYYEISHTGHAEAVKVTYDATVVSLKTLLDYLFRIIDPTVLNRQGNDRGTQYRTGVYYEDPADESVIREFFASKHIQSSKPIVTEVEPLVNYVLAEDYHQDYLNKNPDGYCHIDFSILDEIKGDMGSIPKGGPKSPLTELQRRVAFENATEPPFQNEFWDNHEPGIYVDIVTGEPLFTSKDKFDSGCGWPSFTRPVKGAAVVEKKDNTLFMRRTEVRSKVGDIHLGHVFNDGPKSDGGLRYCINSASLRFVPLADMEKEGYGDYIGGLGIAGK